MKKVTVILLAAMVIIGVLNKPSLASWQEKWKNTLAEAKKDGKVTIYGQVGPKLRMALTEAVKEDLGLDLDFVPGKGTEVVTRITTEIQAGLYHADIVLGGSSTFLNNPKLYSIWKELESLLFLPEILDPKAWHEGKLSFVDTKKKIIPLVLQVNQSLLVNTNVVKPGQIKAYRDVLQPQWKDKIIMYDPTIGGTARTWVNLMLTKAYGPEKGEAFLHKLVSLKPTITRNSRLQIEGLARGRYPITIGVDSQAAYSMHQSGGPIDRIAAEEGSLLTAGGGYLVMPEKQPHPHASAALLNWLLSERGQQVYSQGYGAPAARLGIKSSADISPLALPKTGEKLFMTDENFVRSSKNASKIAKRIFAPLLK